MKKVLEEIEKLLKEAESVGPGAALSPENVQALLRKLKAHAEWTEADEERLNAWRLELVKQNNEDDRVHIGHLVSFGQAAIRGLFLLNGGAAVAFLAFLGSAAAKAAPPGQWAYSPLKAFVGSTTASPFSLRCAVRQEWLRRTRQAGWHTRSNRVPKVAMNLQARSLALVYRSKSNRAEKPISRSVCTASQPVLPKVLSEKEGNRTKRGE